MHRVENFELGNCPGAIATTNDPWGWGLALRVPTPASSLLCIEPPSLSMTGSSESSTTKLSVRFCRVVMRRAPSPRPTNCVRRGERQVATQSGRGTRVSWPASPRTELSAVISLTILAIMPVSFFIWDSSSAGMPVPPPPFMAIAV